MSKLSACKTCGGAIAKDATTCPHCGAKSKKKPGCLSCLFGIVIWVIILIVIAIVATTPNEKESKEIEARHNTEAFLERQGYQMVYDNLNYLNSNPEVSSYKLFYRNKYQIFITLKNDKLPKNFKSICDIAAKKSSDLLLERNIDNVYCKAYLLPANINQGTEDYAIYIATVKDGKKQSGEITEFGEMLVYDSMSPEEQKKYRENRLAEKNYKSFKDDFVDYDGSVRPVVDFVKKNMHNPDSFKHVETQYSSLSESNDLFRVNMIYRGTNGFGAVVTEKVTVEITNAGHIILK